MLVLWSKTFFVTVSVGFSGRSHISDSFFVIYPGCVKANKKFYPKIWTPDNQKNTFQKNPPNKQQKQAPLPKKTQNPKNQQTNPKPSYTTILLDQNFQIFFSLLISFSQEKASSWEEKFLKLQKYFFLLLLQKEISCTLKASDWMWNIWDRYF